MYASFSYLPAMSVNYNWLAEDREELEFILHLNYEVAFYTWNQGYKGQSHREAGIHTC